MRQRRPAFGTIEERVEASLELGSFLGNQLDLALQADAKPTGVILTALILVLSRFFYMLPARNRADARDWCVERILAIPLQEDADAR